MSRPAWVQSSALTANYTHDAEDRLSVRQTPNMSPAGTAQMLYDPWDHLLAETDGAGHVVKQYIWVGDEPVAVLDGTASPVLYHVHADHLQRPELTTNASGNVVWRAAYEPFGTVSSITGTLVENQRFPGQWFQLEAGCQKDLEHQRNGIIGSPTGEVHKLMAKNIESSITQIMSKIYFDLTYCGDPDLGSTESLWGIRTKDKNDRIVYIIHNTPFYVRGISFMDAVYVMPRQFGAYDFAGVASRGGHSTYRLMTLSDKIDFEKWWIKLQDLGCTFESSTLGKNRLYAVDVPSTTDIHEAYAIMKQGLANGIWFVQEAHVGHKV